MRRMHHYLASVFALTAITLLSGCGGGDSPAPAASIEAPPEAPVSEPVSPPATASNTSEPIIESTAVAYGESSPQTPLTPAKPIRVRVQTSLGEFTMELTPAETPMTVDNFMRNYVDAGFYKNTIFHYVDDGFMIAGGGFTADGQAKETRATIRNEAHKGGSNVRGTVAMARDPQYIHSSTSQFLINLVDNPSLDHKGDDEESYGYCVFGKVISGMEVIDKIAKVKVQDTEQFPRHPVEPIVIQSISRIE